MKSAKADIGLVGLGVMGQNLTLNIADHGYLIAVYDRTPERTQKFIAHCERNEPSHERILAYGDLKEFTKAIRKPRKIILLVKAGPATDQTIVSLSPYLEPGDILVDCGNAHWLDTIRREHELATQGLLFLGSGISGGERGARFGPSLMPGGSLQAWAELEPIWQAIAAKVDPETGQPLEKALPGQPVEDGIPCTGWIGPNGAGHYVKMVHNGIEYLDMQLVSETYWLLKHLLKLDLTTMAAVFSEWNKSELSSYLIEITVDILQQKDPTGKGFLVDHILDVAGHKGTGQWVAVHALEQGVPAASLAEAVFARFLSARKEERIAASAVLQGPAARRSAAPSDCLAAIRDALYCAKICAYAQGFRLLAEARSTYSWDLDLSLIAKIWRGGCIIRARLLQKIAEAYHRQPDLHNLMLDPYFHEALNARQEHWREVVVLAVQSGLPIPALGSTLAYFDSCRSVTLPANLIQAQRDYFGAHAYERIDRPRGCFFHLDWSSPIRKESKIET